MSSRKDENHADDISDATSLRSADHLPSYTDGENPLASDNTPSVPTKSQDAELKLPTLNLQEPFPLTGITVTRDLCIAHLKLLAALADLRDVISSNDGLFDIYDSQANQFKDDERQMNQALARIREKRWAVYVTRAVDRFTTWWETCVPRAGGPFNASTLASMTLQDPLDILTRIDWTRDTLPPLDVMMVWHAYMLNPRNFLEDCLRTSRMSFWATGFPWTPVDAAIDPSTFDFIPGEAAMANFAKETGRPWDNLDDSPEKLLSCFRCQKEFTTPWTQGEFGQDINNPFTNCTGFADKGFHTNCPHCGYTASHDRLSVAKFRKDLETFCQHEVPMPGTVLGPWGTPTPKSATNLGSDFPNRLVAHISQDLLRHTDARLGKVYTITELRDELETWLKDHKVISAISLSQRRIMLLRDERIAFRRMMSHYWDNSSPFALDLVGAVIRQGIFIQKMDNIDWLHSPALGQTMDRLIRKYEIFFKIMATNLRHMAVPTLDVDLAWHTHQLSPRRYYAYSTKLSHGRFMDHDDKVDENKLSDGFEWTTKMYKTYTDELYSECTCWYCEAVREPTLAGIGPFKSTKTSKARVRVEELHQNPNVSSDPEKNPHISAHNAVRLAGIPTHGARQMKEMQLKANFVKALRRAEKRRVKSGVALPVPPAAGARGSALTGPRRPRGGTYPYDTYYYYPLVWGYPFLYGYYGPYMADPCIYGGAYASNPACMNMASGGFGNCAAGTCGGGVAAGACGSGGASCAGTIGGCTAAGGMCGGAGGFGGCGGGGGGGGCGGGGGGGCGGGGN